jgi:hypothetical protein
MQGLRLDGLRPPAVVAVFYCYEVWPDGLVSEGRPPRCIDRPLRANGLDLVGASQPPWPSALSIPEFLSTANCNRHTIFIWALRQYLRDTRIQPSIAGMQEHWRAGYHDAIRTLRHPEVLERPTNHEGVFTFDLSHDGRE